MPSTARTCLLVALLTACSSGASTIDDDASTTDALEAVDSGGDDTVPDAEPDGDEDTDAPMATDVRDAGADSDGPGGNEGDAEDGGTTGGDTDPGGTPPETDADGAHRDADDAEIPEVGDPDGHASDAGAASDAGDSGTGSDAGDAASDSDATETGSDPDTADGIDGAPDLPPDPCVAIEATGDAVGDVPEDVTLLDCDGVAHSLRDLCAADAAWIYLYTGWCPPCQRTADQADAFFTEFRDRGLASYLVITQTPEFGVPNAGYCAGVRDHFGLSMPVLYDPDLALPAALGTGNNAVHLVLGPGNVIAHKDQYGTLSDVREVVEGLLP